MSVASSNSYYSVQDEDALFPLSFSNSQETPLLSHSITSNLSESSSYEDELLLNSPLLHPHDNSLYTHSNKPQSESVHCTNNDDDEFMFSLDQDNSYFKSQKVQDFSNSANKVSYDFESYPEAFMNAAQQNYRIWLSSV
ncbi:hypothetical protein KAFR_0F01010 [Kazachstania africana CBS 2517]|uniref:Uncharacterized protein n=1 Tax=Kazachstania africana (strain ATCC 22294 / BCRC 22015 / CBS 2517 / CECT 1963 / NBRC 1671 / NRRL Y-8276) TaxID=1071382 RepID=H2AWE7_KAZAF|nr:hypothetical protein KAFR_0F01010 [Kazachstania africana CBS 2517]CCF58697.1 hypothetical protein KAFR_0F01010 [Kazachstania africana CBS 2517]